MSLDPEARRYAGELIKGLEEEAATARSRELQIAKRRASASGASMSGALVRELGTIYGKSLGALLEARVEATVSAYVRSKAVFDDEALAEEKNVLQLQYEQYLELASKALVDEVRRFMPELGSQVIVTSLATELELSRSRAVRRLTVFRSEQLLDNRAKPLGATGVHEALKGAEFAAARSLFSEAEKAVSDAPRRDRDTCANAFDALESVGKVVFGLPHGTFGNVLKAAKNRIHERLIAQLQALEVLRHNEFGHGTTIPFSLTAAEVDFVFRTCAAAIVLLAAVHSTTRPGAPGSRS